MLRDQLPDTLALLRAGRISEWQASLVQRETSCVSAEHRRAVDKKIARDLDKVDAISPAPDTMTWFGALLPVREGVSIHKALLDEATRREARGDTRSRGAIMADALVQRILAPHLATATGAAELPLMINIVVPDTVLLGDEHEDGTGWVDDYGDVPGDLLREWIAGHADPMCSSASSTGSDGSTRHPPPASSSRWTRRAATSTATSPSSSGSVTAGAAPRDVVHADGGPTGAANGQGSCEACNYAKEAFGWSARPRPGPNHVIMTHTPTGHRYYSFAPAKGTRLAMDLYPITIQVA